MNRSAVDKQRGKQYNESGDIMKQYEAVLFDLDGTLSASAEGIRRCIELTMEELQKPLPDLSDYSKYIGPPLNRTFSLLCGLDDADVARALPIYRAYYDVHGTKANRLYDGMRDVLQTLKDSPVKVAVCTSKNERLARDVIDLLGIGEYLDAVCGSRDDGTRKEKKDLIPYALETLGHIAPENAVMIGDTYFDTAGAVQCGVDFIGVLYGYGTRETMQASGAEVFADTPGDILNYIPLS
jgi:phosphoglycolate phosphatase